MECNEETCFWVICPCIMYWSLIVLNFATAVLGIIVGIIKNDIVYIISGSIGFVLWVILLIVTRRCCRKKIQNPVDVNTKNDEGSTQLREAVCCGV